MLPLPLCEPTPASVMVFNIICIYVCMCVCVYFAQTHALKSAFKTLINNNNAVVLGLFTAACSVVIR